MKRLVKIAGVATLVAVLAVGAVATVALAQEGTETTSGWNFQEKLHEAIASILGITVEKYEETIETAKGQVLEQAVADGWLTQEQADRMQEQLDAGPGPGRGGMGFPGMRGMGGMHGESLISITAEQLGMSVSDLMNELQDGKSIADVATEKGVDKQTIADAYLAQVKENLDQAVADGDITQKQADAMLQNMTEQVTEQLEAACGGCMLGGPMGPGGRGPGFGGFMGAEL